MSNKFSCSLFKDSVYKCVKTASSYPCLPNFKLLHPEMKHTRDHTWRAQKKITNMDLQGFGEIESRASRWILKLLFYTWDIEGLRKDQQVLSWKRSKKALICLDGAADWPVWPCCWKQVNRNAAYYLSMWKEVIFTFEDDENLLMLFCSAPVDGGDITTSSNTPNMSSSGQAVSVA